MERQKKNINQIDRLLDELNKNIKKNKYIILYYFIIIDIFFIFLK